MARAMTAARGRAPIPRLWWLALLPVAVMLASTCAIPLGIFILNSKIGESASTVKNDVVSGLDDAVKEVEQRREVRDAAIQTSINGVASDVGTLKTEVGVIKANQEAAARDLFDLRGDVDDIKGKTE